MNKAKLKTYAPQARRDFIKTVGHRANLLGFTERGIEPAEVAGDAVLIGGKAWPRKIAAAREKLAVRIRRDGLAQTLEAMAYTWFNRFAALRYMELHEFLGHGYRVLSNRAGNLPEILEHAADLDLPGLQRQQVIDLKLAGDQDNALYRLLLIAQCNALASAMPFLFERIDDETELLLPDNLLHTDSVIAKLVADIAEEDWREVEIIGWLYQFYISEKKDQVIGKVVKSEDIPAATQLFTPNWIVKYLVQNSVGRLWLMANPHSGLKAQMDYYIEPAEQTPEVQAQLDALIQTRMDESGGRLDPETLTVLDPACGSGHILVEAYDLLKQIYLEAGFQPRSIARLILEKNLYGLDIDERAAQMAGFALLMKARADDRRILENTPRLNVLAIRDSKGLDVGELAEHLQPFGIGREALAQLVETFAEAKTFGSLTQIPKGLDMALSKIVESLQCAANSGDVFAQPMAEELVPLVWQAVILGMKFDAVVANPPYMGGKGMNPILKDYAKERFINSKTDLFAMFMEQGLSWCKETGFNSMVTMQNWMFLSSFESIRKVFLTSNSLVSLIQLPYDGKSPTAMGINFGISLSIFQKAHINSVQSTFDCYRYFELTEDGVPKKFPSKNERNISARPDDFNKIPGSPVAYWVSYKIIDVFCKSDSIENYVEARQGLATGDNNRFLRLWHEVNFSNIGFFIKNRDEAFVSQKKWFTYNKGGKFRKWYGNQDYVIAFDKENRDILKTLGNHLPSEEFYFKKSISWSDLTSADNAFRAYPEGTIFDACAHSFFCHDEFERKKLLAFCNSSLAKAIIKILNPTMHFHVGYFNILPYPSIAKHDNLAEIADEAISISRDDWDDFESSYNFKYLYWASFRYRESSISPSWQAWAARKNASFKRMQELEENNNKIFIEAYGLDDVISADVSEEQVTLVCADREKDSQRLMSYAIGCMMGRYSLDEPGLIYAQAGNIDFDASRYKTFPADSDGIIPLTDEHWFEDDAAQRIREFLLAVWGPETLAENLAWLAESLGKKASETPDETIRRYLSDKFFKDHLQTYKKRPIYWLFSSGKQGAFQALVYLHRYHEGTLARMRNEYVIPLAGKIAGRIEFLEQEVANAPSTAARNKAQKALDALRKKQAELAAYDEQLRHYSDLRIALDLDDGVKVNYGKFGNLLAEVKAVTGGSADD